MIASQSEYQKIEIAETDTRVVQELTDIVKGIEVEEMVAELTHKIALANDVEVDVAETRKILEAMVDALDPVKMLPKSEKDPGNFALNWHKEVSTDGALRYALNEMQTYLDAYVAALFQMAPQLLNSHACARHLQSCAQAGKELDVTSLRSMISTLVANDPENKHKYNNYCKIQHLLDGVIRQKMQAAGLKPLSTLEKNVHTAADMLFQGQDPERFLPEILDTLVKLGEGTDEKSEQARRVKSYLESLERK